MKNRSVTLIVALVLPHLLVNGSLALAQNSHVTIKLEIDREKITINDALNLRITLTGPYQKLPAPDLGRLRDFDIERQNQSQKLSIINGVMQASTVFNLVLLPKRTGTFELGPASVQVDDMTYTSNSATVIVVDAARATESGEKGKDIFLTASVSKDEAYVGEQITLMIKFYHAIKLISQPNYTPPRTTDFWSKMITPQKTYFENHNGRRYRVTEISTALFPTRSGDLEIGRASLEVSAASKSSQRRRDPFFNFGFGSLFDRGETHNLRSRPIKVKVNPLPTKGKPDNFTGAVGRYSMSASVDQREVEVNSPVSVTFKIEGEGNIMVLPKPEIPELSDFRVYSGSSSENVTENGALQGGQKIFEEIFIPKREGELTIPAIKLTYFDPKTSLYSTARTRPITLTVKPSKQALASDIPIDARTGATIGSAMRNIRYIKTEMSDLNPVGALLIFKKSFIILNFLPILAIVGALFYRRRNDKLSSDVAYARSRFAGKSALKRLKEARKFASVKTSERFFGEIRAAVLSFVADKLNISPHSLSLDRLTETLREAGFDAQEAKSCCDLITRADFARYAGGEVTLNDITASLKQAEEILTRLQEAKLGVLNGRN